MARHLNVIYEIIKYEYDTKTFKQYGGQSRVSIRDLTANTW